MKSCTKSVILGGLGLLKLGNLRGHILLLKVMNRFVYTGARIILKLIELLEN